MKIIAIPESRPGKWAVGLGVALVALMAVEVLFAAAIGGDPAAIDGSPLLSALAGALSVMVTLAGPLSLFFGIYAIIKHKERSLSKSLAVLYGVTVLLFLLGEFLFPH